MFEVMATKEAVTWCLHYLGGGSPILVWVYRGFVGSIRDITIASHRLIAKLQPEERESVCGQRLQRECHLSYPSARENLTRVSKHGIPCTRGLIGTYVSRVNKRS